MARYEIETRNADSRDAEQRLTRDGAPVSRWFHARYEAHEIETEIPRLHAAMEAAESRGNLAAFAGGVLRGLALGQARVSPDVRATFEALHGGPYTDTDSMDEVP